MQTKYEYTHVQAPIMQVWKHATCTRPGEHKRAFILTHVRNEINMHKMDGGDTTAS